MKKSFATKLTKGIKRFVALGTTVAMLISLVVTSDLSSQAYVNIPAGGLTDYNYSDIEYNYAKLLQYSLYMYDANMCGTDVGETSLFDWRDDCHTFDTTTYRRNDGQTVTVDLTGGYHDAGDHVKFGLPEAYSGFVLGMSYDTDKAAYEAAGQVGHLQTITTRFADYLVKCAVLDGNGNVEAYCVQVGQGGGGYDHGYWGAPENQTNANRPFYFANAGTPCTDIISLSAATLAMQYKNFGGNEYLDMAKKLFSFAMYNNKTTSHPDSTISQFYNSTGWEDDYCLAAIMLYNITGDSTYYNEYQKYSGAEKAKNVYWPLCWDNVAPALKYYVGDSSAMANTANISGNNTYGGYKCLNNWGSARYNTSLQYTVLLYDKMTGTNTYRSWSEGQMKYLLGNNAAKQCYVVGYNNYGPKYPHHRAASGYSGSVQGTKPQAHTLIGALVGGQDMNGGYDDTASNYQYNEVSIDYNATLVAASAAIYSGHIGESGQEVDANYYVDEGTLFDPTKINTTGIYVAVDSPYISAGMCLANKDKSNIEFKWVACREDDQQWFMVSDWTKGNEWLNWTPEESAKYILVCYARFEGDDESMVQCSVGIDFHRAIKGICQMPYDGPGGGYLIGIESYDNPNQSYRYEMLILDCTLLAEGKDAWIYTTGQCGVSSGNCLWTIWQPVYGYYWTLFRIYDADGNLIDEACYGFENI